MSISKEKLLKYLKEREDFNKHIRTEEYYTIVEIINVVNSGKLDEEKEKEDVGEGIRGVSKENNLVAEKKVNWDHSFIKGEIDQMYCSLGLDNPYKGYTK